MTNEIPGETAVPSLVWRPEKGRAYLSHPNVLSQEQVAALVQHLCDHFPIREAVDPTAHGREAMMREKPWEGEFELCAVCLPDSGLVGRGSYTDLVNFMSRGIPITALRLALVDGQDVVETIGPVAAVTIHDSDNWREYARPVVFKATKQGGA